MSRSGTPNLTINSSIPNLIGGVSQQPELLRLPSHMKSQVNGFCAPARGLEKRPGTTHVGPAGASGPGYYALLDYGTRGVFWLHVNNGVVRVLTAEGYQLPLYDATGAGAATLYFPYLVAGDSETSLKSVKEADTTFLINTAVSTVGKVYPASASAVPALVWIKAGNYGRRYTVKVPGYAEAAYDTPDGSATFHSSLTRTDLIAQNLATVLAKLGVAVVQTGSVLYFPNGPAGITVEDGSGGSATALCYRSVRSVGDLPSRNVPDGFPIKVEGGDATAAGDYYVRFDAASNVWREVRSPYEAWHSPDPATLPHVLVPYGNGFKVSPREWDQRNAGDTETNPGPSFIGKPISDLFFYQDRMGILSGEGFDLSETGRYFNFFRTTVTTLLDSDVVTGSVTSTSKVSALRHAVTFGKRLFFFSAKSQFELQSDQALTPKTGSTQQVAEFECSSQVRPTGLGSTLYFPVDRGGYTAFYNFFLDGIDSRAEASDVSGHVPTYIPKNVRQIAASPANNLMVVRSSDAPSSLYVYQFYTNGGERLQSAWHRWDFSLSSCVRCAGIVGTTLYLLIERYGEGGTDASIETLDLNALFSAPRLDRLVTIAAASIARSGPETYPPTCSFVAPYRARGGTHSVVVLQGTPKAPTGAIFPAAFEGGAVRVNADLVGCTLAFGRDFELRAVLGRFLVREQVGQGSAGVSRGRTQVGRLWVNYADASAFSVEVAKQGREVAVYKCPTRRLGTESAVIGDSTPRAGRFGCPVLSENNQVDVALVNATPLPSTFLSVDWEGYHVSRGQHV